MARQTGTAGCRLRGLLREALKWVFSGGVGVWCLGSTKNYPFLKTSIWIDQLCGQA